MEEYWEELEEAVDGPEEFAVIGDKNS